MKKRCPVLFTLLLLALVGFCLPEPASASIKIADFIDAVELNGDLRVRYDYQDSDQGDPNDRLRQRFRIGLKWFNPSENWEIAAGLATGDLEAGSTNDTYSEDEIFETGDIRLDYAYALHTLNDFVFIAGQQKNVFQSTMGLWDPDVRPAGFTAQYFMAPFFVSAGYYQVRHIDRDIAEMNAVQVGFEEGGLLAAASFYYVHDTPEILEDVAALNPDYDYQIADFLLSYAFETGGIEISPFGHVFYNLGAEGGPGEGALGGNLDPEDENLGWLVGIKTAVDRFSFGVQYAQIGADAAVQDIKDSDFGSGLSSTDIKGFKIGVGYKVTKNMSFATTAYFYEPLERDLDREVDRYQVDLKYKF